MKDLFEIQDELSNCIHKLNVIGNYLAYDDNENKDNQNCGLVLILSDVMDKLKEIGESLRKE